MFLVKANLPIGYYSQIGHYNHYMIRYLGQKKLKVKLTYIKYVEIFSSTYDIYFRFQGVIF